MTQCIYFHFHAYQPGDILFVKSNNYALPMEFEERISPVSISVREKKFSGKNWTSVILNAYEHACKLFPEINEILGSQICTLDIEPYTILKIIESDAKYGKSVYNSIIDAFSKELVVPVMTIPFHPILHHLDRYEQEILCKIAVQFFAPLIRKQKFIGVWFPEGAITLDSISIFLDALHKEINSAIPYIIMDRRQLFLPVYQANWSCNTIKIGRRYAYVVGRENDVSDAFSFKSMSPVDIVKEIRKNKRDEVKDEDGIPYIITIATDFETLLVDKEQSERFKELIRQLINYGIKVQTYPEFVNMKLKGLYNRWKYRDEEKFVVDIKEYSSWSDYPDLCIDSQTSDMRWTGLRRYDGVIVHRRYKGRRVSQIWKQGYTILLSLANRFIREKVITLIALGSDADEEKIKEFLIEYNKIVFMEYYIKNGYKVDFNEIIEKIFGKVKNERNIGLAASAYYKMLMANRSCPRFWDNIDTRVTFQSIALLSQSLIDLLVIYDEIGDEKNALEIFDFYRRYLLDFEELYSLFHFDALFGQMGWESTKEAWLWAIQSEVHEISAYNVVKRAALYIADKFMPKKFLSKITYSKEHILPIVGHIEAEMHGDWKNNEWCEHAEV